MTEVDRPRRPIVELLSLALPTIAQMASYTVMQFIDTWILSRVGEIAATAASNSGMLAFSIISLGMGTLVLVNTLASQSFGRREFSECGRYLWQGIWIGLAYGLAVASLRPLGGSLFKAFGHLPEIASLETTYWHIVLLTASLKLVYTALGQFMLAINRPNCVLLAAIAGISVNAVAAWALVLGRLGFAPHGIAGAAWAQNIGVTCELTTLAVFALFVPKHFGLLDPRPRLKYLLTLLRVGVPSGLQWFSDVLAWSVFCNGVMALLGTAAMAANTFMFRYMIVSFMPAIGLQTAVTALVGRYIGRGQPDIAARRAHLAFAITGIYVLMCGSVFIFARRPLMHVFTHDPEVIRIGSMYLIFAAIYEMFDAMYIIYTGALRGAGDTLVPTIAMTVLCWTISIGGGYAVIRWMPGLGFNGPWIMGCVYGAVMGTYMIHRFVRGRWRSIRLTSHVVVESVH